MSLSPNASHPSGVSSAQKSPGLILAFLMLLNILNMVDRNLLAGFGPQVVADLKLSDSEFGLLTGVIFVFFYSIMGLVMGFLADRYHRPGLIAVGLVVWSALTAYSGIAKNFLQLAIARLFIGVGESCLAPTSMSLLSDLYPSRKRGLASAVYYLGVPLGAGGSFIVAGVLGPQIGWRNSFLIMGVLGLVLALPLLVMKDAPRGAQDPIAKSDTGKGSWRHLLITLKQRPALMLTMIGAIFLHIPIGAANFTQLWLVRERGFEASDIATLYGVLFIIFGVLGTMLGGVLGDWFNARHKGGRVRLLAVLMLVLAPLLLGYRLVDPSSPFFYIGMCTGLFLMSVFYGPAFSTIQDLSPTRMRARMTALLLIACNLIGLGLGSVITGVVSDLLQGAAVENSLTLSLLAADLMSLLTIPCFFLASLHIARTQMGEGLANQIDQLPSRGLS
ncbi:spinster family MFS transporter [Microbulbifer agarilyticus]|uniref:spinster family MFS transporter n=1 Tax=Microbulbifer agarilyticus TaxID=260552 RepID=UPI001CD298D3|nr:MFS transporter [Microbulbifer agarilyticus]MCA0901206.1 MFS transporter [Microbulbifer agarilyticus]